MSAAPGELAHPALALVNSRRNSSAGPIDELDSPALAGAWLAAHGFAASRRCSPPELAGLRELRAAVRELLLARIEGREPDGAALSLVNAELAPSVRRLEWPAAGPSAVIDSLTTGALARARAQLAADAIDLILGDEHADLRACAAPGCVRLLLRDHPRRQWCSNRCGDRVRASRYYHRRHAPAGDT